MRRRISFCNIYLVKLCSKNRYPVTPLSLIRALHNSLGAQLERWQAGLSFLFLKIQKSALILEIKCPNCVHLWNKNVVLRSSRRNSSKFFPAESCFLLAFDKCLLKYPNSKKPDLLWKISCCALVSKL